MVYTPTLTGLGECAHLMSPSISLMTHINDVLGAIQWEELSDIVLCGHDCGHLIMLDRPQHLAKVLLTTA